jgi:hypothetical protein
LPPTNWAVTAPAQSMAASIERGVLFICRPSRQANRQLVQRFEFIGNPLFRMGLREPTGVALRMGPSAVCAEIDNLSITEQLGRMTCRARYGRSESLASIDWRYKACREAKCAPRSMGLVVAGLPEWRPGEAFAELIEQADCQPVKR